MFVREISQGGVPNRSGVLVGQDWSSKRYSLVSLLLMHSPRKTFISKKLPNGFLSPHQFLAFSVFWDSCMRAVHCVRKFCFSFVLNRASAGFTLLRISWQDWSKAVETEGMKVKLCSLFPGAALPWEMLGHGVHPSSPASCLCHLRIPSEYRFALNLLAGAIVANVSLIRFHPSVWLPNRTIFAAFCVSVGFVPCHLGAQGSDWTHEPPSLPDKPQHNENSHFKQIKSSTLLPSDKRTPGSSILVAVFVTHR